MGNPINLNFGVVIEEIKTREENKTLIAERGDLK
jgi:hypothetical protein